MRRFGRLAFLLAIGFVFLSGCGEEEIAVNNISPYAVVLGDENAGGYVVLQGENCFPIAWYIHVDYDTIPFGEAISSDEPALLNLSPGEHHLSVKSSAGVVARDRDGKACCKVYMRWEMEIVAETDYAPLVPVDCDSALLDSVPWKDDKYEQNDIPRVAYDLSGSRDVWLELVDGLGQQWDDDWYKIYVTPGDTLVQLTCTFTQIFGNIDIQLVDISENVLSSSSSDSDDEFISYIVPSSGTYYIKVYGADSGNEYDLLWRCMQPTE
ncbi:PPC domain-containing protein [bacterium]|nr:PPC domain-containing protein [bacterium]